MNMKHDNLHRLAAYLRESEDWLSADELATQLHTSTRTVRNYVKQLNYTREQVIESSIRGYRWITKAGEDMPSYQTRSKLPQSPAERGLYALRRFLWQEKISVTDLLDALIISDRTLDADLNQIRRMLKPFNMSLHRRKEILYLTGKEIDRRRLIAHCVRQTSQLDHLTLKYLTEGFAYLDVPAIHNLLAAILPKHQLELDGYKQYELLLYIVIQMEQLIKGNKIQEGEFTVEDLELSPDFQAAQELAAHLSAMFKIAFSRGEVEYLAVLLLSNTIYRGTYDTPAPSSYCLAHETALECLKLAGKRLKLDFFQADFPVQIAHYFLRMDVRQQMCMCSPHPLTQLLRNVHPLLLEISAEMLLMFANCCKRSYPRHETGGLALMLADYMYSRFDFESKLSAVLVCPAFGNLAEQLKNDLSSHLGNTLTIEHMVTTMDIDQVPNDQLILSVLPLKGFPHAVLISPMPKSEDYRIIREEIQKIKEKRRRWQLSAYLNSYMRPETFLLDTSFANKEEVLHYMCRQLVEDGAIDQDYEQDVLVREQIDQTSFFDMLAVPHSISSKVHRNSLYIALNHVPLPWGNTRVNLIVLIAMQPELRDDFHTLYGLLTLMFAKPKNVRAILQAKNYCEFLEIMPLLDME